MSTNTNIFKGRICNKYKFNTFVHVKGDFALRYIDTNNGGINNLTSHDQHRKGIATHNRAGVRFYHDPMFCPQGLNLTRGYTSASVPKYAVVSIYILAISHLNILIYDNRRYCLININTSINTQEMSNLKIIYIYINI